VTISLHIAGMYALSPVMGWLADRFGAPATSATGLVTLVAGSVIAGLGHGDFVLTTLGLALIGVGWSAATVAGARQIVTHVPLADRVAAQGVSDAAMSFSGALGGLLAGIIMAAITYQGLGLVAAALAALALVFVARRGPHLSGAPRA
jgi:MFS family permease